MNPSGTEEQTKTIKYLNKNDSGPNELSESDTQRQFEQQLLLARRMLPNSKINGKPSLELAPYNCKAAAVQTVEQISNKRVQHSHILSGRPKHQKGKSMDLQEVLTSSREQKAHNYKYQGTRQKGKKFHNKELNLDLRERKIVSEMKHYGSKKLGNYRSEGEREHNFKKKKSKSIKSGDMKQLKKEIKKMIEETPLFIQRKKDSPKEGAKSGRGQMPYLNSKNIKIYSKSEEIFSETKPKKKLKEKHSHKESEQLNSISYSMPMTSKIINLLSNHSSVYNSQKQLESVNKNKRFVIPTEESLQQIEQIRQYEHTILRKNSSERFKHTRKATPIGDLMQQEIEESQNSTQNIIKYYINKFQQAEKEAKQHQLSQEVEGISFIPNENSIKERHLQIPAADLFFGEFGSGVEIQNMSQCESIKLENSELIESKTIEKQEKQIGKLNLLIEQIEKKGQKMEPAQKNNILHRIKELLVESSPEAVLTAKPKVQKEKDSNNSSLQLNNSGLKESMTSQENLSQLNLQILDKALRYRQAYLIQRKQKELKKLEQEEINNQVDHSEQKQKITKWIDHEVKSVVHTRHQIWTGLNFAKQFISSSDEEGGNSKKKNQMMKSLSQKYLHRNNKQQRGEKKVLEEKAKRKKSYSSESIHEDELGEGRVTELDKEPLSKSAYEVSQHESDDEPLLISAAKQKEPDVKELQNQVEAKQENDSSVDQEFQYDRNNVLNQPVRFTQSTDNGETEAVLPQPISLNIKQIECDIEYQNSYNQEDLQMLAEEGKKIQQQMKLPFDLTIQDKQDIYQFIFLDLCVQLTDQYSLDSPIIRKIFSFIKTMKDQSKKQKGFKTNTNIIKDYLFQFISFLKAKPLLLEQVYGNLDKPLGPTALDILKYMHALEDEPIEEESNETVFILDIKLFQQFQGDYLNKLTFQKYYDEEEKQKKRRAFLKNAIHIHNKSIFDALNQTLDKERPFGVWGQPFSWKKIAKFYHDRDTSNKNAVLLKCAQKTIEYGAYMCGFMIDKQECTLKGNPNISQAYIEQIRDDRLSRMLANDLDENEQKMLFIDDEQTEILVEVGHMIYHTLLQQVCRDFFSNR